MMPMHARISPIQALRALLAAVALAAGLSVAAAQPAEEKAPSNPWVFDPAQPSALRLEGDIGPGTAALFEAALTAHPEIHTLILRGEGNAFEDTMEIATRVRDLRMSTRIEAGGYCHFGCGIVFLAGAERRAEGILGVAVLFPDTTNLERAQLDLADFVDLVRSFNLSAELFSAVVETASGGMYAFSPHEIARFGVDQPVVVAPPGWDAVPYGIFYQQPAEDAPKGAEWPSHVATAAWSLVEGTERPQIQMVGEVAELALTVTVTITADPPTAGIRGVTVVVNIATPPDFHGGTENTVIALLSREHEATAGIGGFFEPDETGTQEFTFLINDSPLAWRAVKTHFSRRWLSFLLGFENTQTAELLIEAGAEAKSVISAAFAAWEAERVPGR